MGEGIERYVLSEHAATEMERRRISESAVGQVLAGTEHLQSRVSFPSGTYLVRVFVDVDREPAEVVTVYRTGKIEKYWRTGP